MKKTSRNKALQRLHDVHKNRYLYNNFNYRGAIHSINITCRNHGSFNQSYTNHRKGQGCPECAKITRARKKINIGKNNFFLKSPEIHNDKYNYDASEYINSYSPISILCSIHGNFNQRPNDHLNGHGCPKCANNVQLNNRSFIKKANKKHNFKYKYQNTKYINSKTKVDIECKLHGMFSQESANHLFGQGCPKCADHGFDLLSPAILYYFLDKKSKLYKVGITSSSVKLRFPRDYSRLKVIHEIIFPTGEQAKEKEQQLLNRFKHNRVINETWELSGGKKEFFNTDIEEKDPTCFV